MLSRSRSALCTRTHVSVSFYHVLLVTHKVTDHQDPSRSLCYVRGMPLVCVFCLVRLTDAARLVLELPSSTWQVHGCLALIIAQPQRPQHLHNHHNATTVRRSTTTHHRSLVMRLVPSTYQPLAVFILLALSIILLPPPVSLRP
jgi:hypothetical protein